jgi:hypothetical protein
MAKEIGNEGRFNKEEELFLALILSGSHCAVERDSR